MTKIPVVDRRIQKTRKLLLNALISLILEKGYESTTVQDIIDRANIGRSTFYSHYENKEHLLLAGYSTFQQLIEKEISAEKASTKQPNINFLALYQHVEENFRLAKAIIGKKSGDLFTDHLQYLLKIKVINYFIRVEQKEDKMTNLVAEASAAAMVSLLINWVEENMPFNATIMAEKSHILLQAISKKI